MRPSRTPIRARLLLLVLVATVPFLLFSAALLQRAYRVSTGLIEDGAAGYARRLAVAVDGQVGRAEAVAQALGELPTTEGAGLNEFERAATRALAAAGLEGVLVLADADGRILAQSAREPQDALRQIDDLPTVRRVFDTARSQVSDLFNGRATQQPQIAVHVPVVRNGRVRYDAMIAISAHSIEEMLVPQTLPEDWFAIVAGRDNRMIAHTDRAETDLGLPITDSFAALAASGADGFGSALSRGGVPIFVGFTRSQRTGWLIGVAVPQSVVRGPQIRSTGLLAGGGGLLLLVSLALAWRIGRTVARPVGALAEQAARLGRNEMPDPHAGRGLVEAEAAAQSLHVAALLLRTRAEEREAALRRAEESESRLLLAQEVGQIGVWETDSSTGHRTWSEQQFRLYGLDPASGAPHGAAWAKLIHPDDRARVLATVTRAYGAPMSYQHEFRVIQPGGAVRCLLTAGRSQFKDGAMVRVVGIAFDVTDRHEAERALRESATRLEAEVAVRTRELAQSEERFRTYFENSADAMVVARVADDGKFVFETINKAGERLTGLRDKEIAGKTPQDVLLPETAQEVAGTFQLVVDSGVPLTLERTLALPAGTLELESVLVPVRDPSGTRVVRIISGQRDLTERRRIEGRLSHAQRLEAVGQLTGGVAHDFNNLLTVVIGNLSLLRRRLGDDERALRYLGSVEAAAERGAKLTASLLAFSRRQTLQVQPVDVGAQLAESATLLRRALGEAVEFSLDIAPGLPLATADTAQLEAAVLNLVINARDAILETPADQERGTASVRIAVRQAVLRAEDLDINNEARPGRFVAIEVRDTGVGMTPEVRARAFEPFFTTKEIGQGTGLGLSQVFGFVRQLGGHIALESTPGHGTRVVLYLPVATALPHAAEAPSSPVPLPLGATVLVVEDDDSIREVTGEVLRDAGLEVLTAESGPAALEVLRGPVRVDILFSDVVMPGGATGLDLARSARALRPGLAVLLTSGYGGPALQRYGAEDEYEILAKPYTRTVLLERIGQILAVAQVA